METSEVWQALAAWWEISEADSTALWGALVHSERLRSTVLLENLTFVTDQASLVRFVQHGCSPQAVGCLLDDLVEERHLRTGEAVRVRACVRRRTDPSGQWRRR